MTPKTMLLVKNRKALFDHTLIDKYLAGIVLHGYEVKAIKEGKVSFDGSYVIVKDGNCYITNLYIGKYSKQSKDFDEYNAKRDRNLLLSKKEILEIDKEISQKGKTAVPLALVLGNNLIKLELGVVKGKKDFEKKQVVKDRQILRDLDREAKSLKI